MSCYSGWKGLLVAWGCTFETLRARCNALILLRGYLRKRIEPIWLSVQHDTWNDVCIYARAVPSAIARRYMADCCMLYIRYWSPCIVRYRHGEYKVSKAAHLGTMRVMLMSTTCMRLSYEGIACTHLPNKRTACTVGFPLSKSSMQVATRRLTGHDWPHRP